MRHTLSSLLSRERVTLMIDSEAARLLSVKANQVLHWGSAPIPREAVVEGRVVMVDALAATLRRLWEREHPPTSGVILGLPGVGTRTTLIPLAGPDDPTPEEVSIMTTRLGFDPAEYQVAWQPIGPPGQRAIFLIAIARSLLEGYLAALDQAGLSVAAVDVKPLALIRAIGHRHAVIADLERTLLMVIVVDEGLPRVVKLSPLRAALLSRPEDKVTRLVETLADAINEYNHGASNGYLHPAVPIHLSGALADHPLLKEAIQLGLGYPPAQPPPPFTVPADLPVAQYLANMGLALKKV